MPGLIEKKRFMRTLFAKTISVLLHKENENRSFSGPIDSIIILATEKTGDSILLTPLIRNIRSNFPNIEIHLVCFSQASATFFRYDRNITALHEVKRNTLEYLKNVLSRKFDILVNTKDGPSTNFLLQTALINARYKIGHDNAYHKGIFDHLLIVDFHTRIALKNCMVLNVLGVSFSEEDCRPYIPLQPIGKDVSAFSETINRNELIGINISAGAGNRYWTEEKWSALIDNFPGSRFLIFSAPADSGIKKRIEKAHKNVLPGPETNNIYEAGLLVSRLRLLVSPDTAMIHVASCYGTPVVGLYTELHADQSRFGPFLVEYELVRSNSSQVCDIPVADVVIAIRKMLSIQAESGTGSPEVSPNALKI